MSRWIVIALTLLATVVIVPVVRAGDVEGKVQSVDATERSVTLDNGVKIWLSDSVPVESVTAGAQVKVSYEEKDGKPVATSVEVK